MDKIHLVFHFPSYLNLKRYSQNHQVKNHFKNEEDFLIFLERICLKLVSSKYGKNQNSIEVIDFFGNLFCQYFFLYKNVNFDNHSKVEMDSYKHFYKCMNNLEKLVAQGISLNKIGSQMIHNRDFGLSWPIINKFSNLERQHFDSKDLKIRLELFQTNKYYFNGQAINYNGFTEIYKDLLKGFEKKIVAKTSELQQIVNLIETIKINTSVLNTSKSDKIIRRSILESDVMSLEYYLKKPLIAQELLNTFKPLARLKPLSHFYSILEIFDEKNLFNEQWLHIKGTRKSELVFINTIFGTNLKESAINMSQTSILSGKSNIENSLEIYRNSLNKVLTNNELNQ